MRVSQSPEDYHSEQQLALYPRGQEACRTLGIKLHEASGVSKRALDLIDEHLESVERNVQVKVGRKKIRLALPTIRRKN